MSVSSRNPQELWDIFSSLSPEKQGSLLSYAHFLLEEDISDEEATEEILNDPEMMAAIQKGEEEIRQGKTIPWEDVR